MYFELTEELAALNRHALKHNLTDSEVQRMLHDLLRRQGFARWRFCVSVTTEILNHEEFLFIKRSDAKRFARQHRRAGLAATISPRS